MITPTQLKSVARQTDKLELSDTVTFSLREQFPEIHFTFCHDDDVCAGKPVYASSHYNLYLIDSSDHCLTFTQDMKAATGIVVAETCEE